jgi:purine-binding chemotaxis protein CheW
MSTQHHLVVFSLDGQRYALNLASVGRVIHAVEMIRIPEGPGIILGLINIQGRVLPVLNLRSRLGLPDKAMSLDDHLIIAHTARWQVALVVDAVHGVIERSAPEILAAEKIFPGMRHIKGVAQLEDDVILIHDLETSISIDEEQAIAAALQEKGGA